MTDAPPGIDLNADIKLDFQTINLQEVPEAKEEIRDLLQENGLDLDEQVDIFVVCREHGRLVGCAGLDRDVIKDVAVDPSLRGTAVSLRLGSRVLALAADRGHADLFLYCRPEHVDWFRGWAFHPLVEVPGVMTLLENNPLNLPKYVERLSRERRPGKRIGAIVMNANPFTLGHRFLAEKAAENCDWLHLFVVREDAAQFPYADRFRLITEGLAGIANLTIHHGSKYIISRATFPGYFLKDRSMIEHSFSAIDLLMFREHIAPALGINCRYVGTEPFDATTNSYNTSMKHWLWDVASASPPIQTVVVERLIIDGLPVSASTVRALLAGENFAEIARLVPATTLEYLEKSFGPAREPASR
ncbi:MAG TPA: [citrate (pro-3S)-lyase] ligase [Acetobacteraceae bacterium]|nr:[citrate (pro-3S)-lyase] ligase [Acetobacteraceae bacterium]